MFDVSDYKSENCFVAFLSSFTGKEAESMIGKTIAKVDAQEYKISITFTDGSTFEASGSRWDGCAMGAAFTDA